MYFLEPIKHLHEKNLDEKARSDLSLHVLYHLSVAYKYSEKLKAEYPDLFSFLNTELFTPALLRAYREMLEIRRRLPQDSLDHEVLSKFGRIVE